MVHIRGAALDRIGLARPYTESCPFSVVELELDDPGSGEVMVRIEAGGVRHSDLSVVDGNRVRPPLLLGHEAAGIVERVGDGVDGLAEPIMPDLGSRRESLKIMACHIRQPRRNDRSRKGSPSRLGTFGSHRLNRRRGP